MILINEIIAIAQAVAPTATVILSSNFNANYQSFQTPETAFPLIVIDNEYPKNSEIMKNNNVLKDTRILIRVLGLDITDNTDTQSATIADNMESIADLIAVRIYQLIPVRPNGNQRYKLIPQYRVYNTLLTGVNCEMYVNYNEVVNFE